MRTTKIWYTISYIIGIVHIRVYDYYTEMEFIKPSIKTTVKFIQVPFKKYHIFVNFTYISYAIYTHSRMSNDGTKTKCT